MGKKVAVLATSASELNGAPTGCWAEEIMAPILMFKVAGHEVTVLSVAGGKIPLDEASMGAPFRTEEVDKFLADDSTKDLLENSIAVDKVTAEDFDAVFVPGGHGVVVDMPDSEPVQKFISTIYDKGSIVGSVCHGPCALTNVTLANGDPLVKDKKVTGFSNTEEEAVGKTADVPFLLEDKLKEKGGKYSKAEADWASYAVSDERLFTGQNPGSSKAVAALMVDALN